MASEKNLRQGEAPPESTAPSAPPEEDMAEETTQTQGDAPPYPYQQQPLQEEKSSDYPPHPAFDKEESHNQQQQVQGEGRWGTPAKMGAPANPDAHPANKEAATGNILDRNTPDVQDSTPDASPQAPKGKFSFADAQGYSKKVGADVQEFSKKLEILVGQLWGHLTTGPSIKDTAIGRVNAGTRILTHGGFQGFFAALFPSDKDEKLKKTYACFLSTTTGPVAGTLFISSKKLAYCSDRPLQYTPRTAAPSQGGNDQGAASTRESQGAAPDTQGKTLKPEGQTAGTARQGDGDAGAAKGKQEENKQQKSEEVRYSYYKLIIPIDKIREVVPSVNQSKPAEKYIELVTVDDYNFFFMGFVNYDKGVKNLQEAVGGTQHQE